ncbi:MAG: VF530 family protein [Bacteroidota bacterium]
MENNSKNTQVNNPMHGVKLADILEYLEKEIGWNELSLMININCFKKDPSIKSCLKFLRKTPWAREKVESLYLKLVSKR